MSSTESDEAEERKLTRVTDTLERYARELRHQMLSGAEAALWVRSQFKQAVAGRKERILLGSQRLDRAFHLIETAFGEGQELVIFLTELTMNYYSMKFITDNGCEKFASYNRALLLGGRQKSILDELN